MPQSLIVSNGNLLASFDKHLQMRDFFYPYIGQENHSAFGKAHRIGLWIDGQFSWLNDGTWEMDIRYHQGSLVGYSTAKNEKLQVELLFEDFVYTTHDILFRKIKITNQADHEREFRIFFSHDFYIYGDKMEDTALYEPELNAVLHYRKKRYFLINGQWDHSNEGMKQFTTGKSNYKDKEGTWKDAEDGELHEHPIEQGSVDSTVSFHQRIKPNKPRTLFFWVATGKNYGDILRNNRRVSNLGPEKIYQHSFGYWKQWAKKQDIKLSGVPKEARNLWYQSLLIIRSQIDNRGAIIASTDSDIMQFNKDTYSYTWPRDGALVCMALSKAGYYEVVKRYLNFCQKIITPEGYVLHKFTPEGSLGSSWHPKYKDGKAQIPIQEDESALLLVSLWNLYQESKAIEIAQKLFNPVVLKIGKFLIRYTDEHTGLPKPSYDLWEEQYGVFSYTCATVYGGLKAAENLSKATGHYEDQIIFRDAAKRLRKSILKNLYCKENKRFAKKGFIEEGEFHLDLTIDSSLYFLWEMGVVDQEDERMQNTMKAIEENLQVHGEVGGIARYQGDFYHRDWDQVYSEKVPGNPWIITTLWLANWHIAQAKSTKELHKARDIIDWTCKQANRAQILPEQIDPFSGEPLSVAPLTWSHATFVDTILRYKDKSIELKKDKKS